MRVVKTISSLRAEVAVWRARGERIAFVPTLGNLHAGHISLVKEAKRRAPCVVVSIFVNPLQFAGGEDYSSYPRTFEDDSRILEENNTNILFFPDIAEIYPQGTEAATKVEVPELSDILCGAHRPDHFRGVATVVNKLFNIVQPDLALFGEKDYQQLLIIRRMVADLALPIEIIGLPTVREADGLALSSRNQYLTSAERARAPLLYQTLTRAKNRIESGSRDYPAIENDALLSLQQAGFRPDYFSVRCAQDLAPAAPGDTALVILAAARLGQARLIDNVRLTLTGQNPL